MKCKNSGLSLLVAIFSLIFLLNCGETDEEVINNAPTVANPLSDILLDEGFGTETVNISNTFTDPDGDVLTYTIDNSDVAVVTVAVSGSVMTITETGTGVADITLTATDEADESVSTTFKIGVKKAENNAPVIASALQDVILDEGFSSSTVNLTGTFTDADRDALSYSASSSDQNVVTVSVNGSTLTLSEVAIGTTIVTVTADDSKGGVISDDFRVSVNGAANTAPIVSNAIADITTDEGFGTTSIDISNTFSDPDGDVLSITASSSAESVATVSIAGSTLTISEVSSGNATITVTANDGNGGTVSDEFSVTINGTNTNLIDYFLNEALNESITKVTCTLSDGTVTECYKIVVNSTPEDHAIGPWCPETTSDVGGIWVDDQDGQEYTVDADYLNMLEARGWDIINEDMTVNVTTDEELTLISAQEQGGWSFEEAQQNGIVNHCIQANPVDHETTFYIPVNPVNTATPNEITPGFNATGISFNGVEFFPGEPTKRIVAYQNIAPLDPQGGHTGFGYDYHYHRILTVPNSNTAIIGLMRDGYPIYGNTEPDGSTPTGLDDCSGHEHDDLGYHYHSSNNEPYIVDCLKGAYGEME